MPVARRSAPRRRVYRTRAKYDYNVTTRRYKRLLPIMWPELEWELEVLEKLENDCFSKLGSLGIPEAQWEYYVGFAKRMWNRCMAFSSGTYAKEKTSLNNEYALRGLTPSVLDEMQTIAESLCQAKKAGPPLAPPITGEYGGVTALADDNSMGQWPGVDTTEGVPVGPGQWPGIDALADTDSMGQWQSITLLVDTNEMIQWAGVTVERGTV